MASEKIMNFVEEIKKLSVLELSELVDAIQEEFGVTAAIAAAPAAGAAGAVGHRRVFHRQPRPAPRAPAHGHGQCHLRRAGPQGAHRSAAHERQRRDLSALGVV